MSPISDDNDGKDARGDYDNDSCGDDVVVVGVMKMRAMTEIEVPGIGWL